MKRLPGGDHVRSRMLRLAKFALTVLLPGALCWLLLFSGSGPLIGLAGVVVAAAVCVNHLWFDWIKGARILEFDGETLSLASSTKEWQLPLSEITAVTMGAMRHVTKASIKTSDGHVYVDLRAPDAQKVQIVAFELSEQYPEVPITGLGSSTFRNSLVPYFRSRKNRGLPLEEEFHLANRKDVFRVFHVSRRKPWNERADEKR